MKTIYTTLPIYDNIEKQTYRRSKQAVNDWICHILCPVDELPSFQWLDNTATVITAVELFDQDGSSVDITADLPALPVLVPLTVDSYFVYYGGVLSTSMACGLHYLKITTDAGVYYSDWFSAEDVTDCLKIDFYNDCDLGNILYQTGFTQKAWLRSEAMETLFPIEEEGVKNGEGVFIRTFARQVKKYVVRVANMPDYMVDVFHRMKLHDTVLMTDLVGDLNEMLNLEVDHEWLYDDKYYARIELTFDYDEAFTIGGCCNNLV